MHCERRRASTRAMAQRSEAGRKMSDGDNATPGPNSSGGSSAPDGSKQWLTRTPRPSPGAAPWERRAKSGREEPKASDGVGHHTDGVTVADLIAKLNGDQAV